MTLVLLVARYSSLLGVLGRAAGIPGGSRSRRSSREESVDRPGRRDGGRRRRACGCSGASAWCGWELQAVIARQCGHICDCYHRSRRHRRSETSGRDVPRRRDQQDRAQGRQRLQEPDARRLGLWCVSTRTILRRRCSSCDVLAAAELTRPLPCCALVDRDGRALGEPIETPVGAYSSAEPQYITFSPSASVQLETSLKDMEERTCGLPR